MGTANILLKCVWACVDLNNDMGADQWFDTRGGFVKFRNLSWCGFRWQWSICTSCLIVTFYFWKTRFKMWLYYVNLGNQIIYPGRLAGNWDVRSWMNGILIHCVMLGLLGVFDRFRMKRGEGRGRQGRHREVHHWYPLSSYGVMLESVLHLAIWKISDWKSRRWLHVEGMAD